MKYYFFLAFFIVYGTINAQNLNLSASSFDFWEGKWRIHYFDKDSTKILASNEIIKILDGKVMQEFFVDPSSNFSGTSISVFNPNTKTWHQAWADNNGGYFNFIGDIEGEKRIFKTLPQTKGDKIIILRMVFHDITSHAFIWDWESSTDNGMTWKLNWQLFYEKIE